MLANTYSNWEVEYKAQDGNEQTLALKSGTIPGLWQWQVAQYGHRRHWLVPDETSPSGYKELSFIEVNAGIEAMQKKLYSLGVRKGDKIAFLSPNRPDDARALYATMGMGAVAVPMNFDFSPETPHAMREHIIGTSDTEYLIVAGGPWTSIARDLKQKFSHLKLIFLDPVELQEREFSLASMETPNIDLPLIDVKPTDEALILYTSGTTKPETPKGVVHTHQSLLFNKEVYDNFWKDELNENTVNLGYLPFFHVMGLPVELLGLLHVGGTYAFPKLPPGPPSARDLLQAIHDTKATVFYTVPKILNQMKELAEKDPLALTILQDLKLIMQGGAAPSERTGEYLIAQGVRLVNGYGSTEIGGAMLLGDPKRPDWVKLKRIPGITVELRPVEGIDYGKELVVIQSPSTALRYIGASEDTTKKSFPEPGVYRTGDLYTEVEGNDDLMFVGRVDDVFKLSNGEKVNPLPIEKAIEAASPAIKLAAIVGEGRDYPIAIVQPNYEALQGKQFMEIEEAVWQAVDKVNQTSEKNSKIRRENIIIAPPGREIPEVRKGALHRPQIQSRFSEKIEETYARKEKNKENVELRRAIARAVQEKTQGLRDVVKKVSHVALFGAMVQEFEDTQTVVITGNDLNISTLAAVARKRAVVNLSNDPAIRQQVDESVSFLTKELEAGKHIYGVSSGYGGSADTLTRRYDRLQKGLIRHLNAGLYGKIQDGMERQLATEVLPDEVVRAAMLIRINSNIKGASALRWEVMEAVATLLNKGITPLVPKRGSITASGDLMPLSYVMAVLMGKEKAKASYQGKIISAKEALKIAGLQAVELGPKEGLAFVNGTSMANAMAALNLFDANALFVASQAATALSVEGILGTNQSFDPFIHEAKPHQTQQEVARNILHLLAGSQLAKDELSADEVAEKGVLRQDRYHQRTAPQWIGPQIDVIMQAIEAITIEMNSATDNPLIDVKTGRVLHGGNFQGTAVSVPMDHLRLAIAALGNILVEQFEELANKATSNGLPANLAGSENMDEDMGLKGIEVMLVGRLPELTFYGNPVTNHVRPAELRNQSINSLALLSSRLTATSIKIYRELLAYYLYSLAQAMDLRHIEQHYRIATEEAVQAAVKKTITDVEPAKIQPLLEKLKKVPPFSYAFETNTQYKTLIDGIYREVIVLGGDLNVFQQALAQELNERLPKAKEVALQTGASTIMGRTKALYNFVRFDLGIRFEQDDQDAGPEVNEINQALENNQIAEPLIEMFFSASDQDAAMVSAEMESQLKENNFIQEAVVITDEDQERFIIVQVDYQKFSDKEHWMHIRNSVERAAQKINAQLAPDEQISVENIIILGPNEQPLDPNVDRNEIKKRFADQTQKIAARKKQLIEAKKLLDNRVRRVRQRTKGLTDIKFDDHLGLTAALWAEYEGTKKVILSGDSLNVGQMVAIGRKGSPAKLTSSPAVRRKIDATVQWLADAITKGQHIYGANTGFGGSAETRTDQTSNLQHKLIQFLRSTYGFPLPESTVRIAMATRANQNAKGYSGVRSEVIDNLTKLLNKGIIPVVPAIGSITASGDLSPLAHIVGVLIGAEDAQATYQGKVISAKEALRLAGLEPLILGPKEGLGLVNGTTVANAMGAEVMYDTNVLVLLSQLTTALSVEVLLGTNQSYDPVIGRTKPHIGQIEALGNLLHLLEGSKLARHELDGKEKIGEGRSRQDRYALRGAGQVLAPRIEQASQATRWITTEANAVTDNPLIDTEYNKGEGRALHTGQFLGHHLTAAMDETRLVLFAVTQLAFAQAEEISRQESNNGLLKDMAGSAPNLDFGLKGVMLNNAGITSEAAWQAHSLVQTVQNAEQGNQDVNSLGLISARKAKESVDLSQRLIANHLYGLVQAVDLRHMEQLYRQATEEAVIVTVKKTLRSVVKNADEAEPYMIEHLLKMVRSVLPFKYVFESKSGYKPLFDILMGEIDDILNNDKKAVGDFKVELIDDAKTVEGYAREFKSTLAGNLDELLPKAKLEALQTGSGYLLGNTRPIYEFIRRDLGVRFNNADQAPGPQIERIYEAIRNGRIIEPLLLSFFIPEASDGAMLSADLKKYEEANVARGEYNLHIRLHKQEHFADELVIEVSNARSGRHLGVFHKPMAELESKGEEKFIADLIQGLGTLALSGDLQSAATDGAMVTAEGDIGIINEAVRFYKTVPPTQPIHTLPLKDEDEILSIAGRVTARSNGRLRLPEGFDVSQIETGDDLYDAMISDGAMLSPTRKPIVVTPSLISIIVAPGKRLFPFDIDIVGENKYKTHLQVGNSKKAFNIRVGGLKGTIIIIDMSTGIQANINEGVNDFQGLLHIERNGRRLTIQNMGSEDLHIQYKPNSEEEREQGRIVETAPAPEPSTAVGVGEDGAMLATESPIKTVDAMQGTVLKGIPFSSGSLQTVEELIVDLFRFAADYDITPEQLSGLRIKRRNELDGFEKAWYLYKVDGKVDGRMIRDKSALARRARGERIEAFTVGPVQKQRLLIAKKLEELDGIREAATRLNSWKEILAEARSTGDDDLEGNAVAAV
ncbi:MAG: phenylalanine ammonia-lyase, partial [Candidatus Omnitrophota bacterium]|nr:phenylalanine ammonia-lyase [Candidatus Omnitrophota bacterium]